MGSKEGLQSLAITSSSIYTLKLIIIVIKIPIFYYKDRLGEKGKMECKENETWKYTVMIKWT